MENKKRLDGRQIDQMSVKSDTSMNHMNQQQDSLKSCVSQFVTAVYEYMSNLDAQS